MTDWCILQCSPSATLNLAVSLGEDGYGVWAPAETREIRKGKARDLVEVEMAILPRYVFARAHHLADLLELSRSPSLQYQVWDAELKRMVTKGHPHFSVFTLHGSARPLSDKALAPLRQLEEQLQAVTARRRERRANANRKGPAPTFKAGEIVKVDGGYEGLRLEVAEDNEGRVVKVNHPDWMWPLNICAWKLQRIQLDHASPAEGAALAA